MLPYWILFAAWMLFALRSTRRRDPTVSPGPHLQAKAGVDATNIVGRGSRNGRMTLGLALLSLATGIMIGIRYNVGGDWRTYIDMYDMVRLVSPSAGLKTSDPAYAALMVLSAQGDWGMLFVNLVCGLIMMAGVARFAAQQDNPGLTILVAVPYLIIVVGMGYTRQGVAIGIMLAGLAHFDGKRIGRLIVVILVAALFHKTALLMLPVILFPVIRRNALYAIVGAAAFALLFVLVLRSSANDLVANYVNTSYQSGGAVVRVAMNLVPAITALVFRRRIGFTQYQSEMWIAFSVLALGTFPLVVFASFTTAIDRMALFLIPLQLAVLPRIPYAFARGGRANPQLMIAVIAYSAAVQLVWLVFGTFSRYWVPYEAYFFSAQA